MLQKHLALSLGLKDKDTITFRISLRKIVMDRHWDAWCGFAFAGSVSTLHFQPAAAAAMCFFH